MVRILSYLVFVVEFPPVDVCPAAPWSDAVPSTVYPDAAMCYMFPLTSDGCDANVYDTPQFHSSTTYSTRLIS